MSVSLQKLNNPLQSANSVGLRYVSDDMPGIQREKCGRSFRYRYPTGAIVNNHAVLGRIKSLAIPPAWTSVWICPDPQGHLQATGRDQRRRKQHRYHPRWREVRDETKFTRMIEFARALPSIRRRVNRDLARPGLPREKVLATVVRLLEVSLIRVGNDEYARENDSFGLTTMRNRHVEIRGSSLRFHFRGKGGKQHDVDVQDAKVAGIVKSCQELPGQELFQYVDDEDHRQDVKSGDVNDYLREICGEEFSAKDFRTWSGTLLCLNALRKFDPCNVPAQAKRNVDQAIATAAERLGNTRAICRKCYVHPEVVNAYLKGTLSRILKSVERKPKRKSFGQLNAQESAVLAVLNHSGRKKMQLEEALEASLVRQPRRI